MPAPLIATDMDGTLTTAETWRAVLAWIAIHRPSAAARRFVAVRLPLVALAKAGVYDREAFRARWLLDLARLLRGLTEEQLAAMAEWIVEQHLWPARRTAGVEAVAAAASVASGSSHPALVVLATGAYQPIAAAFARRIGAELALGTALEMRDGVATGRLAVQVQSGEQKAAAVVAHAAGAEVVAAFGDTGADIPLLTLARRAVAVAPDAALRRAAVTRGWEILEPA
jgi:HAD superfamily phosphoserine phosphatase-like hydrolase